jgi:hypothetical protein
LSGLALGVDAVNQTGKWSASNGISISELRHADINFALAVNSDSHSMMVPRIKHMLE